MGAIAAGFLFAATLWGQPATATLSISLTVESSLSLVIDPPTAAPNVSAAQPVAAIALGGGVAVSQRIDAVALARENGNPFLDSPARSGPRITEAIALPGSRIDRKPIHHSASRRRS